MKKHVIPAAVLLIAALLTASLPAVASGSAPIAENLEICTYRGVSVGGQLCAVDPESDPITFEITTDPVKGSIDLDEDGHFVYTPENGKRGKDYFGYRAVDSEGNRSQEATVIIRIEKQKSKVTYSDLSGDGSAYAAVRLAEEGLFVGECYADHYVFSQDTPVTRSEFLALCMKITGHEPESVECSTGFADDGDIDAWARPYVCKALHCGIISGYEGTDTGVIFDPDRSISVTEAAVMLDRAALLTDAVAAWYSADDAVPAWAMQAAANVSACNLLPVGCSFSDDCLTRGDAAVLLSNTMDLISRR